MKKFLLIFCLLFSGCAQKINLPDKKVGGKTFKVVKYKYPAWLKWFDRVVETEQKTTFQVLQDDFAKYSFWMILLGLITAVVCMVVCISVHQPFVQRWLCIGAAGGVTSIVIGVILAAMTSWIFWVCFIAVILAGSWYMYKHREIGVDKKTKEWWENRKKKNGIPLNE